MGKYSKKTNSEITIPVNGFNKVFRKYFSNKIMLGAKLIPSNKRGGYYDSCHFCEKDLQSSKYWNLTGALIATPQSSQWRICIECHNNMTIDITAESKTFFSLLTNLEPSYNLTLSNNSQPYIDAGLSPIFANALVRNPKIESEILNLWEAEWWKQYDVDDTLLQAILEGTITEDEGKWLNGIRSDHPALVELCIEKKVSPTWAKQLMESGFRGNEKAVSAVLLGGKPHLIARIQGIQSNDACPFPPKLENKKEKEQQKEAEKNKVGFKSTIQKIPDGEVIRLMRKFVGDNNHQYWRETIPANQKIRNWSKANQNKARTGLFEICFALYSIDLDPCSKGELVEICHDLHIYPRSAWSKTRVQTHLKMIQTEMQTHPKLCNAIEA